MPKFQEQIGVKIPGQGHYMVAIDVGPFDTDEQVLSRISTRVGTIFNVTGVKLEVVSSSPFRLKKLGSKTVAEEPVNNRALPPAPKIVEEKSLASKPPPSDKRRALSQANPQVGERWKPRDPRRISSFVVLAIEGDHVLTDDKRTIQLARFWRYERVDESSSKAS